MKITVPTKLSNNPFDNEDDFDVHSTGASSLSVTTEGSNDISSLQPSTPSSSNKNTFSASRDETASSSSSPPVQQQQQPQSFRFQGLYKLLGKTSNNNASQRSSNTDAPSVSEDAVDHVLSGMKSPEQARDLLRGIVADLLRENDSLKADLETKERDLRAAQEERNIVKEEYMDRLITVKKTLERSIGGSCGFEIMPNQTSSPAATGGPVISPEQATSMVIQSLSNKVEQLSVEKETLEEELARTVERMEDLESINETRLYKIEALEAQFRSINKTRLSTAQPNIKASCRRQGTDSPAFEVTLPSRAITPRSKSSSTSSQHQSTTESVVSPPGRTTDTGISPVKKTKKQTKTTTPPPRKSKKMSRSTPRQALSLTDVNSYIEVGPGMGEI